MYLKEQGAEAQRGQKGTLRNKEVPLSGQVLMSITFGYLMATQPSHEGTSGNTFQAVRLVLARLPQQQL